MPAPFLEMIIVIPVYLELDFITHTIQSLKEIRVQKGSLEIIFVLNDHEKSSPEVLDIQDQTESLIQQLTNDAEHIDWEIIRLTGIKHKVAGVGHARKAGMDEAVRRFLSIGKNGIISCLDADCVVQANYFESLTHGFDINRNRGAASIHFEHLLNQEHHKAIVEYELHLRYFIDAQRRIKLPFAYQTIGSSMAVRSSTYASMGGMNQRKAGEDFYFLQKFIAVDQIFEINTTTVFPSDRISSRVPFGTGKAVGDLISNESTYQTYSYNSFLVIKELVLIMELVFYGKKSLSDCLNKLDQVLRDFLVSQHIVDKIAEIKTNTTDANSFRKRFYQWFNAFRFMKCLHYLRDNGFDNQNVHDEVKVYLQKEYNQFFNDNESMLIYFRNKFKSDPSYYD